MNEHNIPEENDVLQENAVLPETGAEPAEEAAFDTAAFEEAYAEKEAEAIIDQAAFEEAYAEKEQAEEALNEQIAEEAAAESGDTVSHELLQHPEVREELNPAEHAMYDAGLVHPDDVGFVEPRQNEVPQEPAAPCQDAEYRDPEFQQPVEEIQAPEEIYEDSEAEEEDDRPVRKGRPRRKKGYGFLGIPHLIATVIWLAIIVAIGVSMGRLIWVCAADVLAFGREEQIVTVTITSDDDIDTIAEKLNEAGLVRYPSLFKLYADLAVDEGEISTGTFTLNTLYDYHALVNSMSPSSSTRKVIEGVLIPEGFTCKQIFARLEEYGVCSASELEAYAADGELDEYWFLENLQRGDKYCLEGYLFPATYDFYENSSPKQALEKMLDAFDAYYSAEMQEQLTVTNERLSAMMLANGCSQEYVDAHQLTVRDIITVASLIEKEMASEDEARLIASVIYNRLTQDEEHERYLNIDAAIFYALGEHKEALTSEDLQVDSPYNTYLYSGLVPGPIANPGLACLKAALDFEDSPYYYYVLNPEIGEHDFSKTYEEHDKKVQKYYGQDGEG